MPELATFCLGCLPGLSVWAVSVCVCLCVCVCAALFFAIPALTNFRGKPKTQESFPVQRSVTCGGLLVSRAHLQAPPAPSHVGKTEDTCLFRKQPKLQKQKYSGCTGAVHVLCIKLKPRLEKEEWTPFSTITQLH